MYKQDECTVLCAIVIDPQISDQSISESSKLSCCVAKVSSETSTSKRNLYDVPTSKYVDSWLNESHFTLMIDAFWILNMILWIIH